LRHRTGFRAKVITKSSRNAGILNSSILQNWILPDYNIPNNWVQTSDAKSPECCFQCNAEPEEPLTVECRWAAA
jgi:hypothetical protein